MWQQATRKSTGMNRMPDFWIAAMESAVLGGIHWGVA
ncbi:MAG: hypothetical protein V7631_846 [Massilia sp.]|jgi:hypothetical protein